MRFSDRLIHILIQQCQTKWSLEPQMRQELLLLGKNLEQYATALAEIVGIEEEVA